MIYGRDEAGRFILMPDAEGDIWHPDWPVCMLDWFSTKAYATWRASRDGKGWRLMLEQEYEKAARGVDGRFHPWGDVLDPSWCCMYNSHRKQPLPTLITDYPVDVSVYGIRGLGGNMREWCADIHSPNAPASAVVQMATSDEEEHVAGTLRVLKGGAWGSPPVDCRAAARFGNVPSAGNGHYSVRLTRSWHASHLT